MCSRVRRHGVKRSLYCKKIRQNIKYLRRKSGLKNILETSTIQHFSKLVAIYMQVIKYLTIYKKFYCTCENKKNVVNRKAFEILN